jgi:mono/diheme cytochrome c family protein
MTLGFAGLAVAALFVFELVLLARFLGWGAARRDATPAPSPRSALRWTWAGPLVLGLAIAIPALVLGRAGGLAPGMSGAGMPWEAVTDDTPAAQSAAWGERAYLNRCAPCHLPEGTGLPPSYPSLVGSHVLAGPPEEHARVALWGSDELAHHHPGVARMPAFAGAASDAELAAILTYERRRWGPAGEATPHVRPSDVARARAEGAPAP